MTFSHPLQWEHESLNMVEVLMWMLTLFDHQNFSEKKMQNSQIRFGDSNGLHF
jgi:hypothetical protein